MTTNPNPDRIVADGHRRCLKASEYEARREALVREIEREYFVRLAEAGWWRLCVLEWQKYCEIRQRTAALRESVAPRDGLYFQR